MFQNILRTAFNLRRSSFLGIPLGVSAAFRYKVQANERKRFLGLSDHRVVLDTRRNSNQIRERG